MGAARNSGVISLLSGNFGGKKPLYRNSCILYWKLGEVVLSCETNIGMYDLPPVIFIVRKGIIDISKLLIFVLIIVFSWVCYLHKIQSTWLWCIPQCPCSTACEQCYFPYNFHYHAGWHYWNAPQIICHITIKDWYSIDKKHLVPVR